MATGTGAAPGAALTLPAPSRRPGSSNFADVYGSLSFGTRTAAAGGEGATREAAAAATGAGPITVRGIGPDFLARPAGALVALVALLAAWSYLDR